MSSSDTTYGPIWVYESNASNDVARGARTIAVACRDADSATVDGPTASNYALATCDSDGKLLDAKALKTNVSRFCDYATQHEDQQFLLLPSFFNKTEQEFARYADLFRNAPSNCQLSGCMLDVLGRLKEVRVIVMDANLTVLPGARNEAIAHYFNANEGLWNADAIEIVSIGSAESLVANDRLASSRGYRHRIFNADVQRYKDYAPSVRELLSVAYATKFVTMNDPSGTSLGTAMGVIQLAAANGLEVSEVRIE